MYGSCDQKLLKQDAKKMLKKRKLKELLENVKINVKNQKIASYA